MPKPSGCRIPLFHIDGPKQPKRTFFCRISTSSSVIVGFRAMVSSKYSVVGIAEDDTLSVRSRPSQSSSIVVRLPNGATQIQVVGQTVMNGNDDWVPIIVAGIKGWVRPKYLSRSTTAIATAEPETTELRA